ncbi:MAG: HU family DNA-binding protein [Deltaproteobacteria bacterium]|nr:HU family DNA-binding protein [Deltaproteobacteria bacterium]
MIRFNNHRKSNSYIYLHGSRITLGKDHLINQISSSNGFPKKAAGQFLESLLEIMKYILESGEPIMIYRFGKFQVKDKNNRRGRNPQTGVMP